MTHACFRLYLLIILFTYSYGFAFAEENLAESIDIPAERSLFVQNVTEFKTIVQKNNRTVSSQECQAYYMMLKKITFVQAEQLESSIFRSIIIKHKHKLFAQEQRLREYFFRILGQGLVSHSIDDILRAKADLMIQALFFSIGPVTTVARARNLYIGSLPVASVVNISVASIRVLFTLHNTFSFLHDKKHFNEAKSRLKNFERERVRLQQVIAHPPTEMSAEKIAAHVLDEQEVAQEIKILEPAVKQASIGLKRSAKYLGLDALLTSAYFSSALPYLLGASGLAVGLTTTIIGTIGYGAILGVLIGAKTVADIRQLHHIEEKIERIKKMPIAIIPENTDPAIVKIKDAASNLRLDNLIAYQRSLNKMNLARDFITLGLAASIMTIGVMNIVLCAGVVAIAGATIATGYGVAGVAGIALIMSCVVYGMEHYWGGRFHDFVKSKILGKPLNEGDFPAAIYHRMLKDHRRYYRNLKRAMRAFEANLDRFSKNLAKSPSMNEIQTWVAEFFASNFDVTDLKHAMDKVGVKIAPYQVVLQTMTKDKSKVAKDLFLSLDSLDPKLFKPLLELLEIDPTILDGALDLAPLELVRYVVSLWILSPA